MAVTAEQVEQVFEAWRARQRRPALCRLTEDRKSLIKKRLKLGYEPEDFEILVAYAWEAQTPEAKWWRGDNPNGTRYLDLGNLLVERKLAGRVERALNWRADREEGPAEEAELVARRGNLALYRGGRRAIG